VQNFLARDLAEPDGARLAEQFSQYLDGAEAIARAGSKDSPKASRDALEAIRRLRKAQANAAQVTQAVQRTTRRTGVVDVGVQLAGAATGLAAAGPGGAALGAMAMRGARVGDWLTRAGRKLGWAAGKPLDMAALLGKDALAEAPAADLSTKLADDIFDGPFRKATPPPLPLGDAIRPHGIRRIEPGARPEATPGVGPGVVPPQGPFGTASDLPPTPNAVDVAGAPRGVGVMDPKPPADRAGVGPVRLDPRGQAVQARGVDAIQPQRGRDIGPAATEPAPSAAGGTPVDELDAFDTGDEFVPPDVETARVREGGRNAGLHYEQVMAPEARARELSDRRTAALSEEFSEAISKDQFDELVDNLRSVDARTPEGESLADILEKNADKLIAGGLIVGGLGAEALSDETEGAVGAGAGMLAIATLGKSKLLGAKFYGKKAAAEKIVAEALHQLPPPPPIRGAEYVSDVFDKPEIMKLRDVSKKAFNDLSKKESDAIAEWVRTSENIRREQRIGVRTKWFHPPANDFEEALDKLTVIHPTKHGELYRHMDLPDEALAELLTRDDYVADAAFSTAYYPDSHFGAHQLRFTKVDRAGALIGPNPAEAEMVIPHGSRFRVTGRYADPETGNFVFELEEVPETKAMTVDVGHLSITGALGAGAATAAASDDEGGAAGAAAMFGSQVALFKSVRGRVVAQAARRLFSATADALPRVTARLVYSRTQIEERQREFQAWQANPQELVDRVAEGFRDVPPEHSGTVAGGVFRTATFLKEKLPSVTKTNAVSMRQIPVSAEAMNKYARYEQAALNPREAITEAAESRHLSTELLETLQALYPDLLAELRVQAYLEVREAGPPTTIQARANYAQLFDGDGSIADPAFSQNVARMTAYAYEQSVPTKPPAPGGTPGVSRQAMAVASPRPGAVS
jgi:hypothetical protein